MSNCLAKICLDSDCPLCVEKGQFPGDVAQNFYNSHGLKKLLETLDYRYCAVNNGDSTQFISENPEQLFDYIHEEDEGYKNTGLWLDFVMNQQKQPGVVTLSLNL